jgi:hypothetical protein
VDLTNFCSSTTSASTCPVTLTVEGEVVTEDDQRWLVEEAQKFFEDIKDISEDDGPADDPADHGSLKVAAHDTNVEDATPVVEAEPWGHWLTQQTSCSHDLPRPEEADDEIPYPENLPGMNRECFEAARSCWASDGEAAAVTSSGAGGDHAGGTPPPTKGTMDTDGESMWPSEATLPDASADDDDLLGNATTPCLPGMMKEIGRGRSSGTSEQHDLAQRVLEELTRGLRYCCIKRESAFYKSSLSSPPLLSSSYQQSFFLCLGRRDRASAGCRAPGLCYFRKIEPTSIQKYRAPSAGCRAPSLEMR